MNNRRDASVSQREAIKILKKFPYGNRSSTSRNETKREREKSKKRVKKVVSFHSATNKPRKQPLGK